MFLLVSVILSTGGESASVHAGIPPPAKKTPPAKETPHKETPRQEDPHQGDTPCQGDPPAKETSPAKETPREADSGIWSMSGQYASYWNAFLLQRFFIEVSMATITNKQQKQEKSKRTFITLSIKKKSTLQI